MADTHEAKAIPAAPDAFERFLELLAIQLAAGWPEQSAEVGRGFRSYLEHGRQIASNSTAPENLVEPRPNAPSRLSHRR